MFIMVKGQVKIQQTAFMLIAITLFFVLAGLFFLSIKMNSLKNSATDLEEKNTRLLLTKLADSPEFSCGTSYGTQKTSCVDFAKIMILKKDISNYTSLWGVSDIQILKIYPQNFEECTFENYPDCGKITLFSENSNSGTYISTFVSLCRRASESGVAYDKCEIAKLMVSYNDK